MRAQSGHVGMRAAWSVYISDSLGAACPCGPEDEQAIPQQAGQVRREGCGCLGGVKSEEAGDLRGGPLALPQEGVMGLKLRLLH